MQVNIENNSGLISPAESNIKKLVLLNGKFGVG